MNKIPVIAIFDVGKTNKKLFLFDQQYNVMHEESKKFEEIKDDDGFPCEDLQALTKWIRAKFARVSSNADYNLRAVNFSAYGASLVNLDEAGKPLTPLYNYLKPYPEKLKKQFYDTYGGESLIAKQTASPVLGSLNSGMQLYRLKYEQPKVFSRVKYSLHLPQYLSFTLSSEKASEITSIGCHTQLWDFQKNKYHRWVYAEGLQEKFPPIFRADKIMHLKDFHSGYPSPEGEGARRADEEGKRNIAIGIGLHDSSAALIPYLKMFDEPFILLSTGTWCITLNPFNQSRLSDDELEHDCLCYLSYEGKPVKASRLFAGYEHEQQVKRLAEHFNKPLDYYTTVSADAQLLRKTKQSTEKPQKKEHSVMAGPSAFAKRDLTDFKHYEDGYHQLIADLILQQTHSTNLVLKGTPVKKIFVDGGFANNSIYMQLLALSFPEMEIYAASVAQASAIGAALAIHKEWNPDHIPSDLVKLKLYKAGDILNRVA